MTQKQPWATIEELKALAGKELSSLISPPIGQNDIRKFAMAIYWPDTPPRLFWDEDYARQSEWQGIIAPQEFNPFAWVIGRQGRLPEDPAKLRGARPFNAGTSVEYGVPMRPGDVITATQRVAEVYERSGRSGRLIFVVSETLWRNQCGAMVKTMRNTLVQVVADGVAT